MKKIPAALIPRFKALLVSNRIPGRYHAYYLKWLRYYLDFCHKYGFDESDQQSLPAFIRKLEKRQAAASQEQAFAAIRMYYGLIESGADHSGRAPLPKPQYLQPLKEPQKPVQKPTPAKEIYQPSGTIQEARIVPETGEYRRYHLHETHVQKAIRRAVNKAKICKRARPIRFATMPSSGLCRVSDLNTQ